MRWRIAIEYVGKVHFTLGQQRKDHRKDELQHRLGWTVLRITIEDHQDPEDFFTLLDDHPRAMAARDEGTASDVEAASVDGAR